MYRVSTVGRSYRRELELNCQTNSSQSLDPNSTSKPQSQEELRAIRLRRFASPVTTVENESSSTSSQKAPISSGDRGSILEHRIHLDQAIFASDKRVNVDSSLEHLLIDADGGLNLRKNSNNQVSVLSHPGSISIRSKGPLNLAGISIIAGRQDNDQLNESIKAKSAKTDSKIKKLNGSSNIHGFS